MSKSKFCTKCGNELDLEDEYCEKCGKPVKKRNIKENEDNYDVELSIKSINVYGNPDGYTKTDIEIPICGKTVSVDVPNSISTEEKLRLKGLGYEKPNGTKGDVYLIFQRINYHFNKDDFNKSQLKSLKCPSCGAILDFDDEDLDICNCKYCRSTVFFEGLSNEAYRSKTKIKKMKHEEIMADKHHEYNKELTDKKYNYKKNEEIRKFKLGVLKWGLIILGFSLFYYFSFVKYFDDEEKKSIKQEEELQLLVEEVMDLVEDKDYDEACLKAKSIIYTENWSSEIEEKWDKKRKETINYIIKEEKKDKGKSSCKAEKEGFFEGIFD